MNALDKSISIDQRLTATRPIAKQTSERQRPESGWLAITGLLLLGTLPVIGGVLRLGEVSSGTEIDLLWTSIVAIVAHIVGMTVFCLLGAFQFSPALRIRRGWHRAAGRALIPAGFIAALSSIWLAVFFGGPTDEFALAMVRLVFAVPMIIFLVMAVIAITRRDFTTHGAWMTRAYAIAISGGTQALVFALWTIPLGEVDAFGEAQLVAAGFVINSVVAELIIRRRSGRRKRGVSGRGALRDGRAVRTLDTPGEAA
ncbi:DUF2306 domain-containing protein [Marisediminicola antarctica]|uniref:DUF2306 domain-containing protein n=1 Tax=Marisediminicola antarctica TaxID=674079 RepID=A0A7L5AMT4_9MICO|nr:DUF2306 domain-containing protein [Marisediminicola antarctica]QHO69599.1 hypothetical protein BHD05_08065 [Marisediminicola antarctica]